MCNRYVAPDVAEMERFWHIGRHNQPKWWKTAEVFPRAPGPFIRSEPDESGQPRLTLVVGQWGLIPWFAKSSSLTYSTNNARVEDIENKASFKQSWRDGKRCIVPAWSFDEPCWETGRNVWWRFRRADGQPWGLAGLWNAWTDKTTGEIVESYTLLTINADDHPIMSRMHKPDPKLPADQQDKRSVIALNIADTERWLQGTHQSIRPLLKPPLPEDIDAAPLLKE
jgi:putative SOS response-associated peptidase YedK